MVCYCNKCGRIVSLLEKELNEPCDYCKNITQPVPDEYLNDSKIFIKPDLEQQFIDEYIKSSPEFDQYLFGHRDEDLFNRRMEDKAKLDRGKAILEEQAQIPKCPSCGSSNISKIGVVNKVISTALLGLASSKIGKTHKCNNCGTMW
jgi:hypothetical protein